MTSKHYLESYPRVTIAGNEFYKVPTRVLREWHAEIGLLPKEQIEECDPEDVTLWPYFPPDDKLEFPGTPPLEEHGPLVRSGIAVHTVYDRNIESEIHFPRRAEGGFSASQLHLFGETDWYGECFSVLEAHEWTSGGAVRASLVEKVRRLEGERAISEAKKRYGDEWECYVLELASIHFTKPLSRLWYAANMKSLYYCHHDDLRLGYLWCEYRTKMRYELFALKHMATIGRNQENGKKGGQREKKLERYDVLNSLAKSRFKDMAFSSDRDCIVLAKKLAAEYDKKNDMSLFVHNNKPLGTDWYEEWLPHFRRLARGND